MSDVNIGATLSVNTGTAGKSVNDLKGEIKDLTTQLNEAVIGSQNYTDAQDKLKAKQDELAQSTGQQATGFGALKDKLTSTVPAFGTATEGASSLGKELLALAANPLVLILVAIVAALKFLYDAFSYSVEGGKKMEQIMAGIHAAIDVVVDRIMLAGQAIVKFFSGDFKGAAADMSSAFSGVGDAVAKAYDEVSKATAALQVLAKQEREASVARAQQNAAIVKSKELLNDETASIKDRQAALKLVSDNEKKIGEEDIKRAQDKLEQEKIIWGQEKEGLKKHAQDIADAEIQIANLQEETARKEIQVQRQFKTLQKQQASEDKAASDAAKAKAKEARENEIAYDEKLLKLHQEATLASIKDEYKKELQALQFKNADEQNEIKKSLDEHKITRAQYNELILATIKNQQAQVDALTDKHNADLKKKQAENEKATMEAWVKLGEEQKKVEEARAAAEQKRLDGKKKLLDAQYALAVSDGKKHLDLEKAHYKALRDIERQELVNKKADANELLAFDAQTSAGEIAISNAERDAKLANATAVGGALNSLSELAGKNSIAGKALAVANATISTYVGAAKALENPFPMNIVATAAVIANGLTSVKNIVSADVPGSSSSMPSSSTAPGAPIIPQAQTTTLDSSSIQAVGNAAAGGVGRAYVLESDVTNNQERVARLNRAARIG